MLSFFYRIFFGWWWCILVSTVCLGNYNYESVVGMDGVIWMASPGWRHLDGVTGLERSSAAAPTRNRSNKNATLGQIYYYHDHCCYSKTTGVITDWETTEFC
jgi:hypothetical protein